MVQLNKLYLLIKGKGGGDLRKKGIVLGVVLLAVVLAAGTVMYLLYGGQVSIVDRNGQKLAALSQKEVADATAWKTQDRAYLGYVLQEASQVIAQKEGCALWEAAKLLAKGNYKIYTAYDPAIQLALADTYSLYGQNNLRFAGAVTDLHGHLLAAYSGGTYMGQYVDFTSTPTPPYSSFKTLSVYTPALEAEKLNFSTLYLDGPIKKIEDDEGKMRDWPANSSGIYSEEMVLVVDAVKKSLNTVAVRAMEDLGLQESFRFLKESFDLTLEEEERKAYELGDTEVYGNVALGYLERGVTPVQMAGFYQIFGNGGQYASPKAVTRICDSKGNVIYQYTPLEEQVISKTGAAIMNRILQTVITSGGTGSAAGKMNVPVAGKTGTGDLGNWFIGVTPEYSCAIWHGLELKKNTAAEMFAHGVSQFPHSEGAAFAGAEDMQEVIFCGESGLRVTEGCKHVQVGVYDREEIPDKCNIH